MGARNETALALERMAACGTGRPDVAEAEPSESRLSISVVFTSAEATRAALRKAGELAQSLRARVTLIVPQIVPYPLPLSSPPVLLDWSEARFRQIAAESLVDTVVRIYLCRDRLEMLRTELQPRSLVVIGGPVRWWATHEKRLARRLRLAGHEVVFAEME